jgi:tRNA(Ile)-lysidine synthase TilS/MesJ
VNIIRLCKNCLIPENYPNIELNNDGICKLCIDRKASIKTNNVSNKEFKTEFEEFINKIKGKQKYDCVLLFSGGKDSSYMLYLLKEKYDLNVLTVSIENGLEPHVTQENIKKAIKIFNVYHIVVRPENDLLKRIYRQMILNPEGISYGLSICHTCQKLILSSGLNIAVKNNIPLVIAAYSPDQKPIAEWAMDNISNNWTPKILYSKNFSEKDRSYYWNPNKYKKIPRIMFPLLYDSTNIEDIITVLENKKINTRKRLSYLYTNCHMGWLTIFLDLYNNNFCPYLRQLSKQIRDEKTSRLKWLFFKPVGCWLIKNKLFKRKELEKALNHIDLSFNDIKK